MCSVLPSLSLSVVVVRLIFEKQQLPKEKVKLTVDAELRYQNDVDDREKKTKTRRPTAAIAVVRRHRRARRTGGLVGRHPSLFQVLPRSASLAQRRVWTLESTWLERI